MSIQDQVSEICLMPDEWAFVQAFDENPIKRLEIIRKSGLKKGRVDLLIIDFMEIGYVLRDYKTRTYMLDPKYTFVPAFSDGPRKMVKLEATYKQKPYKGFASSEVKVMKVSPEEIEEQIKRMTSNKPYLEFKKGVPVRNENYRHIQSSR